MAKGAKGKAKPTTATPADARAKSSPPSPYSTPPPALKKFLELLNPKHVYITHIDRHSRSHKIQVFAMTAALNVALAFVLVWRASIVLPWYMSILFSMWGYETDASVDAPKDLPVIGLLPELLSRTFNLFFDFALAKFVLPWPLDFFFSHVSPTSWRLAVGFQAQEVGVRRSRKWDEDLPKDWLAEDADGLVYKERIMPAIDRAWVKAKTSYLMMDKSWDLDFVAMIHAHDLVKSGANQLKDFEKTVIVHSEDFGWLVWRVWKMDEGAGGQDEGRQKILMFKDKLMDMGKEDLFYRWVEIVQYESSQPGGFTAERQAKAMQQARELFQAQDVDFDKFWKEVGGDTDTAKVPSMSE